ncbi:unnamed protein product [Spirodela intermedia]|uniref:Uncharacterized protein n=1 Tax=Spirodela intermedia TaxID=51605 RepID=A0A7I8LD59_SPIIN|nr:unnamed protein product [Spirodela intermedia]
MGVEILKDDFTSQPVEDTADQNKTGKLDQPCELEKTVNFDLVDSTQETVGVAIADTNDSRNDNLPKDAVDEWPAPQKIHTFYFVKYQSHEDPKLKARLEQVDKEIQKRNKDRFLITEALKKKRAERSQVISQLKPLTVEDRQFRTVIDGKRKEMEPLQVALGKLRNANNAERGMGICSSEEELDVLIKSLHYRIQHESNTLTEEKQLLKDIKNLEGTRERVIANAAMKAKLQDSLGPKEAIQDQVKLIGVDLDGVRKEKQAIRSRIKSLEDELKAIDEDIASLQEELAEATQKKDKSYETFNELKKTRSEGNAFYYLYRSLLNNARDLAAKKDVAALEELSNSEVGKFISQWSRDKAFREDYEKRILLSLDKRQLSRDGRMRNPDEKPILAEVAAPPEKAETQQPLAESRKGDVDAKQLKALEPAAPSPQIPSQKALKEEGEKLARSGAKDKGGIGDDAETFTLPEKSPAALAAVAIDSKKLKEMKREEEIAKAKQALERKKKQAEKAATKAAIRAQKEAEKKQKEREKKAKKKAGTLASETTEEQSEADLKAEEQESDEAKEALVPSKARELKDKPRVRGRPRGLDGRPKITIPRKKKAHPYWQWAALALAAIFVLVALGFYYYSLGRN